MAHGADVPLGSSLPSEHRYTEYFDCCQMGGGLGGWVKMGQGLRSANWMLQNSHGDVKHSLGNVVSNIVITMYDVR